MTVVIFPAGTITVTPVETDLTEIAPFSQKMTSPILGSIFPFMIVPRIPIVAVFVSRVKFCGALLPIFPVIALKAPWLNLNLAF